MEKYKNGFLLGKFYPFHQGHIYLIEESLKRSEKLTVLICTMKEDREMFISAELRYNAMCEYFKGYSNLTLIHHNENVSQYPEHHPKFWNIWMKLILSYIDAETTDVIFSSEQYGNEISKRLNIKHCCIDIQRTIVPISGTNLRNNLHKFWQYLPQEMKRPFIKSVALMGPESSFKSSLTKMLADKFGVEYIEEYGREYCEKHHLTEHSFQEITIRHNNNFINLLNKTNQPLIILDTENITTKVFKQMYFPDSNLIDLDLIPVHSIDLRIILAPNEEKYVIQDGTRKFLSKKEQEEHCSTLIHACFQRNLAYDVVSGNFEEKFEKCYELIKELLY